MFSFIFIGLYDTGGLHFICCPATTGPGTAGPLQVGLRAGSGDAAGPQGRAA